MACILYENSKGRSWPLPDAVDLTNNLRELEKALLNEEKYKPNLPITCVDQQPGDVCMSTRNRAAHTLRCLRVWFDLPENVFFMAVNFLDRFLTVMKVGVVVLLRWVGKFLEINVTKRCIYFQECSKKLHLFPRMFQK